MIATAGALSFLDLARRRARLEAAVAVAEQGRAEPAVRDSLRNQLAAADAELAAARAAAGETLPLSRLAARLQLRPLDERVLLALVALETDPLFAITVTALAGEEPRHGLSARLFGQLFRFSGGEDLRLGAAHPIVEAGLIESGITGDVAETMRPFRAAARVISFLDGSDAVDPILAPIGGLVTVPEDADFGEAALAARDMLERVLSANEDVIISIEGIEGVGRRTLVAATALAFGKQVVAIDAARLSSDRSRALSELRALRRECWLRGAVPILARLDVLARRGDGGGDRLNEAAHALESPGAVSGPAVVTVSPGSDLPDFRRRVVRLRLDAPGPAARLRIWTRALGPALPKTDAIATATPTASSTPPTNITGEAAAIVAPELPTPPTLSIPPELPRALAEAVQFFAMPPAGIRRAAENARMLARGAILGPEHVRAGVTAEIQARFGTLATRVTITQGWDDLVLPQDTLDDVKAFASRAGHAGLVYDRWGFRDKLGRGLGLAALFSGPPGTGKTMVAGLIARMLGLDMYMVDLSQVVSKWVGETEKQLGRIFDAAAMGQALLLFDEADALFAKRTEVKSSNDRYANLEVNYLLQRIEQFGGIAILTTNLEASVDPAFKRRLAADVRFYPPDREERKRLWRTLIPSLAPVSGVLDFDTLSDVYRDMCGGHIRNAVLRAAFLAAAESKSIEQQHLARAARVEYRAMGKVL